MEANNLSTLPRLAQGIAEWFPEFEGRVLPVSESEITAENVPTLPLCMLALSREEAKHNYRTNSNIELSEDFLVEFWLRPDRYKKDDGSQTPFWSFYDYTTFRNRLLKPIVDGSWYDQSGQFLEYVSMDIESDSFATVLTFRMKRHSNLCVQDIVDECETHEAADGGPFVITTKLHPSLARNCPETACEKEKSSC